MILKGIDNFEFVIFKIIALYGKCDVFFSTVDPNPNEEQNEGKLIIENDNISSIQLKIYEEKITFKNPDQIENIFIGIYAYEYTVLDIYSDAVTD